MASDMIEAIPHIGSDIGRAPTDIATDVKTVPKYRSATSVRRCTCRYRHWGSVQMSVSDIGQAVYMSLPTLGRRPNVGQRHRSVHNAIANDFSNVGSDIGRGLTDIATDIAKVANDIGRVLTDVAMS